MGRSYSILSGNTWKSVVAMCICAALAVGAVVGLAAVGAHAAPGSVAVLSDETFQGASVPDPKWIGLGDACLTAAQKGAPASGGTSNLSGCDKVKDSPTNLGSGSDGYLQLTDNSNGSTGAAVYDRAFPSTAGLQVSFYQYQYAGINSGSGPGDGIGFFLTDGSYTLKKPGPQGDQYGGALGYASIQGAPGIANGYLGVGLDVYGNYANQPYVGTSCKASKPFTQNAVTLRGSGDGDTGYCVVNTVKYEAGLQSAPEEAPENSAPKTQQLVTVTVSPTTASDQFPVVTVSINGAVILSEKMKTPAPPTLKMGFAASTGGAREVHLIRNVDVKTINPLGAINLVKTVDHTLETGTTDTIFTEGQLVPYSFLVTNSGLDPLNNIVVSDPKIANIKCPSVTLEPATAMSCTGTYGPLTANDVATGTFTNTADVVAKTPDQTSVDDTSTVDVPTYQSALLSLKKIITGDSATAVPATQSFNVSYSYPAGDYVPAPSDPKAAHAGYTAGNGTLTLTPGSTAVTSIRIPTGAKVTFAEATPAPVDGYTWGAPVFSINPATVGATGTTAVELSNPLNLTLGSVSWNKVDPDGKALAGSEWTLTPANGDPVTVVDNGAKDEDSAAGALKVSGLTWGDYTLTETKAPVGYEKSAESKAVTIDASDLNVSFGNVTNTPQPGSVSWNKVDPDGKALAGSEWTLTPANGDPVTVVDNGAKDEDQAVGALKVSGLTWGDYTLTETKAPVGYTISGDPKTVTINAGNVNVPIGNITNTPQPGSVSWNKVDPDGKALAGSEWTLTPANGDPVTVVDNGAKDEDQAVGALKVSGLTWGDYTLTETKAPVRYEKSPNSNTLTINAENQNVDFGSITNTPIPGSVSWNKVDPDGKALAGSEWTLTAANGDPVTVVDNGAKDEDSAAGALKVSGLTWGDYTLTETKAPVGYEKSAESKAVTIDASDLNVSFGNVTNTPQLGSVSWNKVDPDGKALAGSEWTLTAANGDPVTVVDNGAKDEDSAAGALKVSGLTWGDYTLTETKAPVGYLLGNVSLDVKIDAEHVSVELPPVKNVKAAPAMHVKKTADPVSGSVVSPGQIISYTVAVENTGNLDLTSARLNDDLSDVLDNATYVDGSASAKIGDASTTAPVVAGNHLTWAGPLKVGQSAQITYKVKVNENVAASDKLVNVVTGSADVPPGMPPVVPNCVPGTAMNNTDCSTTHTPNVPTQPTTSAVVPTTPAEPSTPSLPNTGANVAGLAIPAALLALLGAVALVISRKRRESE